MANDDDMYDDLPDLIDNDIITTDYTINEITPIYDTNILWTINNNINIHYYLNNYLFNYMYFPDTITNEQCERISDYLSSFR
jgi:hypothetical protein